LRTALFVQRQDAGLPHTSVFLSNGRFECALPRGHDAEHQADAVRQLFAAVCREDARHLTLDLYHPNGREGSYQVTVQPPSEFPASSGRRVRATYRAVEEAFLVELALSETRTYHPEVLIDTLLPAPGEVEIQQRGETLKGVFGFSDSGIGGRFRAKECEGDTSQLDIAMDGPGLVCP
jgi:hypothetical protein